MRTRETRRFGMGDLMILIAALAVGIAGARGLRAGLDARAADYWWSGTPGYLWAAAVASTVTLPLTLACLVCRLRGPRPSWRRVALRPGTVAVVACLPVFAARGVEAALAVASPKVEQLTGITVATMRWVGPSYVSVMESPDAGRFSMSVQRTRNGNGVVGSVDPMGCFGVLVPTFGTPCGYAVAAAWLALAVAGRWRPERSWIDRLGRVLGVAWIVITAAATIPIAWR